VELTGSKLLALLAALTCCAPQPRSPADRAPDEERAPEVPLPPLALERLSPEVREAWRLAEELASAGPPELHTLPAADIRALYALGWVPWQASRRAVYERVIDSLRAHGGGDARELSISAVLVAHMQESLGLDWRGVRADECKADPTLCAEAISLRDSAIRIWLARAREGYRFCATLGARVPELDDWRRYCEGRAAAIRRRM
jgi:hypothetical protein